MIAIGMSCHIKTKGDPLWNTTTPNVSLMMLSKLNSMSSSKQRTSCVLQKKIGHVICSCKRVKVDFAPYYGWDMWHEDSCNLMRQLKAKPQLANLWQYSYLPAIYPASDVPADKPVPLWIDTRSRRCTIKVRRILPQMPLPLFGGLV